MAALTFCGVPFVFEPVMHSRFYSHRTTEETETEYIYSLVMPGVGKEQVEAEVVGNKLVVKANAKDANESFNVSESFTLPKDADNEKLKAALANGILKISVPKRVKQEAFQVSASGEGDAYKDGYTMTFRVPGAGLEDVSAKIEDDTISVKADAEKTGFFRSFEKQYGVPSDAKVADARLICKNGILTLSVPKLAAGKVEVAEGKDFDDEDMYSITVELPGIEAKQISLEQIKNRFRLIIRDTDEDASVLYDHTFKVPSHVDNEKVVAAYKNGLLTIAAPRKIAERYTVSVTDGSEPEEMKE